MMNLTCKDNEIRDTERIVGQTLIEKSNRVIYQVKRDNKIVLFVKPSPESRQSSAISDRMMRDLMNLVYIGDDTALLKFWTDKSDQFYWTAMNLKTGQVVELAASLKETLKDQNWTRCSSILTYAG